MAPIVLGYWDIRGYAQPIRLMLAAAGAEFTEEFHSTDGPPDFSKEKWFKLKPTLPLDFPNRPYLYDGDVKISQSITIMRYLGRKFGMEGKTEPEKIRVDLIEQQLVDWRNQSLIFYSPDFDNLIAGYKEELKGKLDALSKFLGTNEYLSGGGLTYGDFFAYEYLDVHRTLAPGILSGYHNLEALVQKIESIPNVKEFMNSSRFIKYPFNNNQAKWGSRYVPL